MHGVRQAGEIDRWWPPHLICGFLIVRFQERIVKQHSGKLSWVHRGEEGFQHTDLI
jgi:hypothetical protein